MEKNIYYVYVGGKHCNPCFIKYAASAKRAKKFFKDLNYKIVGIVKK